MEPIERATKILLGSMYPTVANIRFYFNGIWDHLNHYTEMANFDQYMLTASINQKLGDYWTIIDDATIIASILDPWNKISLFELSESISKAINVLQSQFSLYSAQRLQSQISSQENSISPRNYFHQLKKRCLGIQAAQISTSSNSNFTEIERYLALPQDENIDPLLWWWAHSNEFPILLLIARDYLAIQATSVACE